MRKVNLRILAVISVVAAEMVLAFGPSVFASEFCIDKPVVWFVHGFRAQEQDYSAELETLKEIFNQAEEIKVWRWDAPNSRKISKMLGLWFKTLRSQKTASVELYEEIKALPQDKQRRLVLIGHSLGAGLIVKTLAQCGQENIQIDHFILMGAAINNDDPAIELASAATVRRSYNVANTEDSMLQIYGGIQGKTALGMGRVPDSKIENLYELVIKMGDDHRFSVYLDYFKRFVVSQDETPKELFAGKTY